MKLFKYNNSCEFTLSELERRIELIKIKLKAARVNAGLSQKEAAKHLGVSNKTLGNWEKGLSYPTVDKSEKICQLYGVPFDNLEFLPERSL